MHRVVLSLVCALALTACGKGSSSESYTPSASPPPSAPSAPPRSAAAEQGARLIGGGALVIDVREQGEWDDGHLPMARLVPVDSVGARVAEIEQAAGGKDKPIVLYCRTGSRASHAKQVLEAAGFTNVVNAGGFRALSQAMASAPAAAAPTPAP